jgi:hypothetical protein
MPGRHRGWASMEQRCRPIGTGAGPEVYPPRKKIRSSRVAIELVEIIGYRGTRLDVSIRVLDKLEPYSTRTDI